MGRLAAYVKSIWAVVVVNILFYGVVPNLFSDFVRTRLNLYSVVGTALVLLSLWVAMRHMMRFRGMRVAVGAAPVQPRRGLIVLVSAGPPTIPAEEAIKVHLPRLERCWLIVGPGEGPGSPKENARRIIATYGRLGGREVHFETRDLQDPDNPAEVYYLVQEQARMYQRYQVRMLHGLRDDAALVTVEIASPAPISHPVVDAVGALITGPTGSGALREDGTSHYLSGGYEVVNLGAEQGAAKAFMSLDLHLPRHPLALPDAVRLLYLFDSVEASAAFRLPPATAEDPPGVAIIRWRARPAPGDLPERGLLVGVSVVRGRPYPVRVGPEDRLRHIYVVGQTGTGKTTLLKTMILDDLCNGEGLCVIDPHGDLYKELLGKIPKSRIEDVVLLDPSDTEFPVGFNMLEYETESQRHFLIQEMVGIVSRLMEDEFGYGAVKEFAGPLFFQHMRMNLLLTMSNPDDPGTLLEFYTIYQEEGYWRRWLPLHIDDPQLQRWVTNVLPRQDYLETGRDQVSMGGWVGSKFEGFVFDPKLRNIFGQKRSTINLREIMDTGKILLVNLAKGELSEVNSRFLGMVLLAKLQATAMERVRIPRHSRRVFHVYVDEFQSIATQSFITLLSEGRKFGLSLILANQFVSQIKDPRIVQAIFGNVGTLVCFRLGQADAELMEREMFPVFTRLDLLRLPNWHAYVTTLVNGQTVPPFNVQTVADTIRYDEERAAQVLAWSRERYGRPRRDVEREIASSLTSPTHRGGR